MIQAIVQFIHNGGTHPFDLDGLGTLLMSAPGLVADLLRRVKGAIRGH
jgi:hypothetical protein